MAPRKVSLETLVLILACAALIAAALWERRPAPAPPEPQASAPAAAAPGKPQAPAPRPAMPKEISPEDFENLRKIMEIYKPKDPAQEAERQRKQDELDRMLLPKPETPGSRTSR